MLCLSVENNIYNYFWWGLNWNLEVWNKLYFYVFVRFLSYNTSVLILFFSFGLFNFINFCHLIVTNIVTFLCIFSILFSFLYLKQIFLHSFFSFFSNSSFLKCIIFFLFLSFTFFLFSPFLFFFTSLFWHFNPLF